MLPCECNFPKASRILSAVFKHTHTHTRTVEMAVSSSNQPDFRLSTLRSHESQSWRQTSRLQTGFDPIDLSWTNVVSCSPFWVVLTRLSPCSVPYTIYTMTDGEAFGTLHNRDDESLACQNLVCLAAKCEMSYDLLPSVLRRWPIGRQCPHTYDESLDVAQTITMYSISKVTSTKGEIQFQYTYHLNSHFVCKLQS